MAQKTPTFLDEFTALPNDGETNRLTFANEFLAVSEQYDEQREILAEVDRHGCGEVVLKIGRFDGPDETEWRSDRELTLTPWETGLFCRELGQSLHDRGRLDQQALIALNWLSLRASYAAGRITKKEVRKAQREYPETIDMVSGGLDSLGYRFESEKTAEEWREFERRQYDD